MEGEVVRCTECRKCVSIEEAEIVTRDEKRYWICPYCNSRHPVNALRTGKSIMNIEA